MLCSITGTEGRPVLHSKVPISFYLGGGSLSDKLEPHYLASGTKC